MNQCWIKEPLNLDGIINIFSGYIVYSMLSGRVSEVIMGITMSDTSLIKGKIRIEQCFIMTQRII